MKYSDIIRENSQPTVPVPFLYHATRESNLDAILSQGLLTRFYGAVHGSMDIHPPKPALYLSRKAVSDNLHSNLFSEPVVILKIDTGLLDPNEFWPDDFIYDLWGDEEILTSPAVAARALGVDRTEAVELLGKMEEAPDTALPALMKPFWRWYLMWRNGGEVAYTADIPPSAIVGKKSYPR